MNKMLACDSVFSAGSGSSSGGATRPLLIVDDDPSVRHALMVTFRDLYEVILAESGQVALDLFKRTPTDVAVLDLRMPGLSGLQVLKKLKELDPHVEVILLTAYESVESIREALRLGASDYLTKPYRVEVLREAVQNAMERREVSRKTSGYDKKLVQLQDEMHHQQIREELARTRNEIYASIIHDINGPLTVIAGYIDLIQHQVKHAHTLEGDQLGVLRTYSASIARQVTNCIELSRRYLGFLEGKAAANSKAGIKEILFDVAELLKAHPQARANELVIQPFEEEAGAGIHPTDLLQILLNLTINALQCTTERHKVELYGKLVSSVAPRAFTDGSSAARLLAAEGFDGSGPLIAISVHDNGPGIPAATLERIFDPYFTTKPPGQGTGLGLSIVRRLVFQARGALHVYSHVGEGTVFTVYLPMKSANA